MLYLFSKENRCKNRSKWSSQTSDCDTLHSPTDMCFTTTNSLFLLQSSNDHRNQFNILPTLIVFLWFIFNLTFRVFGFWLNCGFIRHVVLLSDCSCYLFDHSLLLQRLHEVGFNSESCKWFQDFLSQRQQWVVLNNNHSNYLTLSKGVPQGSILGPVLFTIYINNIASTITNCNAHLHADDTVLYCSANTALSAIQTLSKLLIKYNILCFT